MNGLERLRKSGIPDLPGVYIYRDSSDEILYVGKAKSLRKRLLSYLRAGDERTKRLVSLIARVELFPAANESEALLLEANLINEHKPPFNILLRDDKSFPYIAVMTTEEYPRLAYLRNPPQDGNAYFGPYPDAGAARRTMVLLRRLFPLRTCKGKRPGRRSGSPCLNYHIRRCLGPCRGDVDPEQYERMVQGVLDFLGGDYGKVERQLERSMKEAAAGHRYELAGLFRDRLESLRRVAESQRVVAPEGDLDAVGFSRGEEESCFSVLFVRGGRVIGRESGLIDHAPGTGEKELIASFLEQFYALLPFMPPEILLPVLPDGAEAFGDVLGGLRGAPVRLFAPQRGRKAHLLGMAVSDAAFSHEYLRAAESRKALAVAAGSDELARALGLERPPVRLECFDISNTMGTDNVASMAVFIGDRPANTEYRRFRVHVGKAADDFASMRQVVRRRLTAGEELGTLPDLVVVDGGPGQLRAAFKGMEEAGVRLPAVALAKGEEEVFGPAGKLAIARDSNAGMLLQRLRDEAHRFAVSYHRLLRGKGMRASALDAVPGVGPKRKNALLQAFGSVDMIRRAKAGEVAGVAGISPAMAETILATLKGRAELD